MGVETDELYTADVTRTMPVTGEWTPAQRQVYQAVQEAQAAGIAEVKAGADFLAAHRAAMYVIADHLHSWGILPVTADVSCADDPERPGAGLHRRWTLHSTSHMLGIDVHDCAQARNEMNRDGTLQAGYVLTVEPGLYFQANDLSGAGGVPRHRRAHRGRHRHHGQRTDQPVGDAAARPGRDHGVDARGPEHSRRALSDGLALRPQRGLPRGLVIPDAELVERFSRSSGPGGQSVNTTDSRVELRWDVASSAVLDDEQRARLLARLAARIVDGELIVVASEQRSQWQNRTAARSRLGLSRGRRADPSPTRAPRAHAEPGRPGAPGRAQAPPR